MKNAAALKPIQSILKQVYVENENLFYVKDRSFHVANQTPYMQWNRPMKTFGENPGDDTRRRSQMVQEIAGRIYSTFYVSGNPEGEWMDEHFQAPQDETSAFMDALSAANQTRETWDPWWTVVATDPSGNVTVQKNQNTRMLVPNEWKPAVTGNTPLAIGNQVSVLLRKEHRNLQPVFYYVYGEESLPQPAALGRFYFHLKPEGAAEWVKELTTAFNKVKVPFMFKCLNHAALYHRTDSAVLYIEKHRFAIAARLLRGILRNHGDLLQPSTPLFTKRFAAGAAYAEDPGQSRSFGMFWSELLAEAIVKAWEKGVADPDKREKLTLRHIESHGVTAEASYLRSNSFFPYDFTLFQ